LRALLRYPDGYRIVGKRQLSPSVVELTVHAPRVAAHAAAGQFFILRTHEDGERVPFTFSDWSPTDGWIRFVFTVVGKTTAWLAKLQTGDCLADIAGPLGRATRLTAGTGAGPVVVVGGGAGTAVAYPVARMLSLGNPDAGVSPRQVSVIVGARTATLLLLLDELRALPLADDGSPLVVTDDGSAGQRGLVTEPLGRLCRARAIAGHPFEEAFIVGPAPMMQFSAAMAAAAGVPATVSLNPLMVDGTGMCGACRVTVDGTVRFACVDGPDFPAAGVDWGELRTRQADYLDAEHAAMAAWDGQVHRATDCHCFDVDASNNPAKGDDNKDQRSVEHDPSSDKDRGSA
jgi:ferredoxin--NADP+ reductase